jgi:hypothetical protein
VGVVTGGDRQFVWHKQDWHQSTRLKMKRGRWPLGRPVTIFFQYLKSTQTSKFKFNTLLWSKNVQTLHDAIFENDE